MALVPVSPSVVAGFSASAAPSVVDPTGVSMVDGTSGVGSLTIPEALVFLPCARLALRSRPPSPLLFLVSPSVTSVSDVPPAFRSFLVPRLEKKEVRRLPVGVVFETGEVVSALAAAGAAVVSIAGAVVGSATGLSSCGAVSDTVEGSSLATRAGAVSVAAGLVVSFFPKRPPKREFLLFGLGAVSRAVPVAVVSAARGSVAATGAASVAPSVALEAGNSSAPITRAAVGC